MPSMDNSTYSNHLDADHSDIRPTSYLQRDLDQLDSEALCSVFTAYLDEQLSKTDQAIVVDHLASHEEDQAILDGIIAIRENFDDDQKELNLYLTQQKILYESQINGLIQTYQVQEEEMSMEEPEHDQSSSSDSTYSVSQSKPQTQASFHDPPKSPPQNLSKDNISTPTSSQTSITSSKNPIMSDTHTGTITIHDAHLIQPLDENEFLHQVLAKRKIASRIQTQPAAYEKDLGLEPGLAFDSFPDVQQTKEMLSWLDRKIGDSKTSDMQEIARKFQGDSSGATIRRIPPAGNTEEITKNYADAESHLDWKKDLLQKYKGEKREQWEKFFAEDYPLKDELEDQQARQIYSNRFFYHALGLGAVYVFCTLFLWRLISNFSATHLFMAACYMLILSIFPDKWMYELFSSDTELKKETKRQKNPHRKLLTIRLLLSLVLSIALIFTSEGLPIWSIMYFLEYSPFWIITWILSFSLLHFLPYFRSKTSEIYHSLQESNRRYQVYKRSKQEKYMLNLLEQSDRWNEEHFSSKERLRKEKMETFYNDYLETRKRIYEKQLARLRYLYDLGMGGEEIDLQSNSYDLPEDNHTENRRSA